MENPPSVTIALAVRSVDALLERDGSPLPGPGIHPAVAGELRYEAAKTPKRAPLRIVVSVPADEQPRRAEVEAAVHAHFQGVASKVSQQLRDVAAEGRWSFALALLAVTVVLLVSEAILAVGQTRFADALSKGTIMIAWVIMWRPTETLLYARFPLRRERALAQRLADAAVELRSDNPG